MTGRRGWLQVGRKNLQGIPGLDSRQGPGSLTRDFPCHVHSNGDSEAKTQVDTEEAPKISS